MTTKPLTVTGITRPNRPYPTPLPAGTMVKHRPDGAVGVVQRYQPDALPARMGTFPVRWHDGQWGIVGADDVIPVITINAVS